MEGQAEESGGSGMTGFFGSENPVEMPGDAFIMANATPRGGAINRV
jgi:hypothetical protein